MEEEKRERERERKRERGREGEGNGLIICREAKLSAKRATLRDYYASQKQMIETRKDK